MAGNCENEPVTTGERVADESSTVSPQKLNANRENAKKSTGPKTLRGKAHSRGNALKHGLTAKRVFFKADGTPINQDLHELWNELRAKYGEGDVIATLLMDAIVVECWRQGKALDLEMAAFEKFSPVNMSLYIPNLQRYRSASQRTLTKSLELLTKQQPAAASGEEQDAAVDTSALEPESVPQPSNVTKPMSTAPETGTSRFEAIPDDSVLKDKAA